MTEGYRAIAQQCADEILRHKKSQGPLIVAITGDSGSGKSYYSELIREELLNRGETLTTINADDFLISRADREPMKTDFYEDGEFAGKSKWEILENMFRLNDFKRVITELRSGRTTRYFPYRRETGSLAESEVTVSPSDIIIFDSSMLLDEMDYVIMVDVDLETIIERKIKRDADIRTPEQIEEMHRKVQGYYWGRKKPQEPDIIIDNNNFSSPIITVRSI